MRSILKIVTAAAIVAGSTAPAFAHGGAGGGCGSPELMKQRTEASAKACKEDANKCIGFGTHYYGQ